MVQGQYLKFVEGKPGGRRKKENLDHVKLDEEYGRRRWKKRAVDGREWAVS
jgi:hypothetical protein